MAVGTTLSVVASFMIGEVIDEVLLGGEVADAFLALARYLAIALVSALGSFFLCQWLPLRRAMRLEVDASEDAVDDILAMPQGRYEKHDRGYYLNLATSASFIYGDIKMTLSNQIVGSVLSLVVLLAFAVAISPWFVGLFILYFLAYYLLVDRPSDLANRTQEESIKRKEDWLEEGRRIIEEKRSINAIFGDATFEKRFESSTSAYLASLKRFRFYEMLSIELPISCTVVLQVISVIVATCLYLSGQITLGTVVVAYQLSAALQEPIADCCRFKSYYGANRINVSLLRALSRESAEPSGFEGLYRGRGAGVELGPCALYATPQARAEGRPLFSCAGLSVPEGSLVVVKGANGTGKSMLLDYLRGLSDPDDLDGEASMGEALRDAPYLTYPVPLVSGTLEDNLLGAAADPGAAAALGVSSLAGKEFDERVVNVSFGERQKLGLLRVLSAPGGALLLDEPLQNLDEGAQGRVCAYVAGLRGRRTVFAVMHSDGLDEAADLVLEIRDHELVCVKGQ